MIIFLFWEKEIEELQEEEKEDPTYLSIINRTF
jgi:hypothetical protein